MTTEQQTALDLADIQAGALHERPSPYVGRYLLLRMHDAAQGRELVRRLHALLAADDRASDPDVPAWLSVAFTYAGLAALGVPQSSLDSFPDEFRQGMAARAADLGDVGASAPEQWEWPLGTDAVHVDLRCRRFNSYFAHSRLGCQSNDKISMVVGHRHDC